MYINDTTQEQKQHSQLKSDYNPSTIPANGTEIIDDVWYLIHVGTQPSYNSDIEKLEESNPEKLVGVWHTSWNVISLTQPEMDNNLERAYSKVERNIDIYADDLVSDAYANPTQTLGTVNGTRYKKKFNARVSDNATYIAGFGESSLSQEDKDQSKTDQKLSEYEVKIGDDSDKAITNMMKLNTPSEVYAFDIELESWTIWTPPL